MQCRTRKKIKDDNVKNDTILCKSKKKNFSNDIFGEKDTTFVITRVIIEKGNGSFGITISGGLDQPLEDGASNCMAVVHTVSTDKKSVVYNKLFPGDCILTVDNQSMINMTHNEIVNLFSNKNGTVILEVKRRVKATNFVEKFNMIMVEYKWTNESDNNSDYGFKFDLNSWPSYCYPDVKNVVVTSVLVNGPAYGTLLTRDIIVSINNQILYGYTHDEIDQLIRQCNGIMLLEIQRKSKPDNSHFISNHIINTRNMDNSCNTSQMREIKLTKKPNEDFGFGIIGGIDDCPLFVGNVDAFSYAETAGIKSCSVIHRMNSKDVNFMSHTDAVKLIKNSNQLNLLLEYNDKLQQDFHKFVNGIKIPSTIKLLNNSTYRSPHPIDTSSNTSFTDNIENQHNISNDNLVEPLQQFIVKALFDFECDSEKSMPARGVSFKFGDLIRVTNGNDDEWWQAILIDYDGIDKKKQSMGLIPSQNLMSYRHQHSSKKVKFTSKINKIAPKKSIISINSQKNALKKLANQNMLSPINGNKFDTNQVSTINDIMYTIVEPMELNKPYKRPIFVMGPYSDRIQLALEQEDPNIFQFLPYFKDNEILSVPQTIDRIIKRSKNSIHTLLVHDKIYLDVISNCDLHIILIMFKPPSVEWLIKRYKHLSQEEATVEYNYLNSIHDKYRAYFTRVVISPDAYEDALQITLDIIKENSSSKVWVSPTYTLGS